jgi:hypothetical protein
VKRFWFLAVLLILILLCSLSWLPSPEQMVVIPPAREGAGAGRGLRFSAPQRLRPGESGWLELAVLPGDAAATGSTAFSARLDLASLAEEGQDRGQVIPVEETARFRWRLRSDEAGTYTGRLWLYAGGGRELVLAREVRVVVGGPAMGLIWAARIILAAGGLAAWIYILVRLRIGRLFRSHLAG